jgi:uncharacterized protein
MKHIDTARFCKENQFLAGTLTQADLPRLAAEVLDGAAFSVAWQAKGENPDFLELSIVSKVQMKCQRCLGAMEESVDAQYRFEFVKDEAAAEAYDAESDDLDALVHSRQFDLQELIEDEMLMALPLASLHELCPEAGATAFLPVDPKPNPFAVLKNLKNMA